MTPQRREAGVRRRLRLWWVRDTFRQKAAQESNRPQHPDKPPTVYLRPWMSLNALTKCSFACECHRGVRYRDVDRQRFKAAVE